VISHFLFFIANPIQKSETAKSPRAAEHAKKKTSFELGSLNFVR